MPRCLVASGGPASPAERVRVRACVRACRGGRSTPARGVCTAASSRWPGCARRRPRGCPGSARAVPAAAPRPLRTPPARPGRCTRPARHRSAAPGAAREAGARGEGLWAPRPRLPSSLSSSGLRLIGADACLFGETGCRELFRQKAAGAGGHPARWGWGLRAGPAAGPLPGSPLPGRFLRDDYTIQVSINDYLDIYCPHYEGAAPAGRAETFTLFMVDREGYRGCYETPGAFKRWECNQPYAPFRPVRFSEKIQRFTPFSLGFEFQPGETYYYISVPSPGSAGRCLKLRVSVCCKATTPKPATEVPNSQPRGRGGPEDAGPPGRSAAPASLRPRAPCLAAVLLALLRI
ncbi:uncharacterized protein [Struthio camelus]|uniref:uncharacterized protein isoform X1 n=1 Tax=Struthio camelus TaxID=8801 RepID=UPI003603F34C